MNPIFFKSPSGAPGPKVRIRLGLPKTTFHVTIGEMKVSFRGNRSPKFLEREGVDSCLFVAPYIKAQALWLASDIIEVQRQYMKTSYPDIYQERLIDLGLRDRKILQAIASWGELSAGEASELRKGMVEELRKTFGRWKDLKKDLVDWSVQDVSESTAAGRVRELFSPDGETELVHSHLDEAYEEYKRIQAAVYGESLTLN